MAEGDGQEVEWLDALVAEVRRWHDRILESSGGAAGEHTARLYAACARPFQTAFGEDVFPSDLDKAAALLHAIVADHPFVDGNKRTGTVVVLLYLRARGVMADPPVPLMVRIVGEIALETASSGLSVEEVRSWLMRVITV